MSAQTFHSDVKADGEGKINHQDNKKLPITVYIASLSVKTTTTLQGRTHKLAAKFKSDSDQIVVADNTAFSDGQTLNISINKKFSSGQWDIDIQADGFAANEDITVDGSVEWHFSFP